MCGIFGYVGHRTDAANIVLSGLKDLEYRGYDSWGVAAITGNKIVVRKKTGKIGDATVSDIPASSFALGHTRWATHGGVTDANAHPHLDCSGRVAVIHNGIIENYEVLKEKLQKNGHRFVSETDSEVAAHLIEEMNKNYAFPEAVRRAFLLFDGLSAVIAVNALEKEFVAARNGSPLVIGFGKNENYLASDPAAILPHARDVYFVNDGEMAIISDSDVIVRNIQTNKPVEAKKQRLTWSVGQAHLGKFPHYMLKEIYEQPTVLSSIVQNPSTQLATRIKKSYGTYLIGCGTAGHACLAGQYLFSKIAGRHVNWAIGSEFGYHLNFLNKKSLVLALSQSGETMDILESVKKAMLKGAKIASLVNVLGSTLYRVSDVPVLVGAGPEKAVASTKDFTAKLAHLILIAYIMKGNVSEGQQVIRIAVSSTKKILGNTHHIQNIAKKIKDSGHIFVIGRGLSYPASLETALKIKEISYIHAEGLAAGELKHGPLALVEPGIPCIAFLPDDETYGANLAGAMEMKARGGMIIGISFKKAEVFDEYIEVPDAREGTIIPNVIVGQLLAYYLTVAKGLDPDKPRNLAKSVTVK